MPKVFDLEERTAKFGEEIIKFVRQLPKSSTTNSLIDQLVRSGTSIGANYSEADDAESTKDFIHKLAISKKESRETKHWLRMMATACPEESSTARKLWTEAKELHLIFNAIIQKLKNKK